MDHDWKFEARQLVTFASCESGDSRDHGYYGGLTLLVSFCFSSRLLVIGGAIPFFVFVVVSFCNCSCRDRSGLMFVG